MLFNRTHTHTHIHSHTIYFDHSTTFVPPSKRVCKHSHNPYPFESYQTIPINQCTCHIPTWRVRCTRVTYDYFNALRCYHLTTYVYSMWMYDIHVISGISRFFLKIRWSYLRLSYAVLALGFAGSRAWGKIQVESFCFSIQPIFVSKPMET